VITDVDYSGSVTCMMIYKGQLANTVLTDNNAQDSWYPPCNWGTSFNILLQNFGYDFCNYSKLSVYL